MANAQVKALRRNPWRFESFQPDHSFLELSFFGNQIVIAFRIQDFKYVFEFLVSVICRKGHTRSHSEHGS